MLALPVLASILGCGSAPVAEPAPAPAPEDSAKVFTTSMQLHYELATTARSRTIAGDLEGAKQAGAQLTALEPPEVPDGWKPAVEAMRQRADQLSRAGDLLAAGEAVAELAHVCGDCHAATGGGPLEAVKKAEADPEVPPNEHMKRHLWCMDRMWLGLVGPSTELIRSGAKVLSETELYPAVADGGPDEAFTTLERQVHELAASETVATDRAQQARLYGHFLGNCAGCHEAAGVKPVMK